MIDCKCEDFIYKVTSPNLFAHDSERHGLIDEHFVDNRLRDGTVHIGTHRVHNVQYGRIHRHLFENITPNNDVTTHLFLGEGRITKVGQRRSKSADNICIRASSRIFCRIFYLSRN